MIVVAIIAIIATLAAPSLQAFIQRGHVASQTRELTAFLQEARGQAVLLRSSKYKVDIVAGTSGGKTEITNTSGTWSPNADRVTITSTPITTSFHYNLMGKTDLTEDTCYLIVHKNNATIGQVVIIDKNGSIKAHNNMTACPSISP